MAWKFHFGRTDLPRPCGACTHIEHENIDLLLASGTSVRVIAGRYGLSKSVVHAHFKNHVSTSLEKAAKAGIAKQREQAEIERGTALLERLENLTQRTLRVLERAEKAQNLKVCLGAVKEIRSNLEFVARLTGQIGQGADFTQSTQQPAFVLPANTKIEITLTARDQRRLDERNRIIDITPAKLSLPAGDGLPGESAQS